MLGSGELVGRAEPVGRLRALVEGVARGRRVTATLAGEAGIGKTSVLRVVADQARELGIDVGWGSCVDADGTPAYWPWTQAVERLVQDRGQPRVPALTDDDVGLLSTIVPSLGSASLGQASHRDRLLAMDAAVRFLDALGAARPVLLVLDDLQWIDDSSLALLELVTSVPTNSPVGVIGAYRPDELGPDVRARLGAVAVRGELISLHGLDGAAVRELVEAELGPGVDGALVERIHERTGGHPFFVRELARIGEAGGELPGAVREAVRRRLGRLRPATTALLEAMAVSGSTLAPDVASAVLDRSPGDVEQEVRRAIEAGVVTRSGEEVGFSHDLLRETLLLDLSQPRAVSLHAALGEALEGRARRGAEVPPSQLARHFLAAIPVDGVERATTWSLAAAVADGAALAFGEAAARLRRLRAAVADAGYALAPPVLIDVLLTEADALRRDGDPVAARRILHLVDRAAEGSDDPVGLARSALARAQLGAQFAARRDEVVQSLEAALEAVAGLHLGWEARLRAMLAQQLQHSVAEDRPRAGPLSEQALELGRASGDPGALLTGLLARHDLLWTPGRCDDRGQLAAEIVEVARAMGDREREAEGLLLLANSQLEAGSPAFAATIEACLGTFEELGNPRARYLVETRRACLALLRGDLPDADQAIERAAALGARIREPDTANVRMSQRLELVRAGGDDGALHQFALEAVGHWTGAPVHAHAVAAGFLARSGHLADAAQHVAAVEGLGSWRAERSYLWSVLVRELAWAVVALDRSDLAGELLDELVPLGSSCGVNGAAVAFAGAHAHTAAHLAAHLGQVDLAESLRGRAAATYRRLGAAGWLAELAPPGAPGPSVASLRRVGSTWHVSYAGIDASVPHVKGMGDVARLLSAGGAEIHALDLMGSMDRTGGAGPVVDAAALAAYRRRLADLEEDVDDATGANDIERASRAEQERQELLEALRRATTPVGGRRQFANHPAERARKAVTARIRDAIRRLEAVHPQLAAHLQHTIVTGTYCRHRPDGTPWQVDLGDPGARRRRE